jgi:hypothetical protein
MPDDSPSDEALHRRFRTTDRNVPGSVGIDPLLTADIGSLKFLTVTNPYVSLHRF